MPWPSESTSFLAVEAGAVPPPRVTLCVLSDALAHLQAEIFKNWPKVLILSIYVIAP